MKLYLPSIHNMWTVGLLASITWYANAEDYSGLARSYYTNYYKDNVITTDDYTTRSYSTKYTTPTGRKYQYLRRRFYNNPMPECAAQQVCNAVFMRLRFVQPLCKCARSYQNPCSSRMHSEDGHTINLIADRDGTQSQTLVKLCEDVTTVKTCNEPHDWMLLALQNVRTGKAHYLVVCRCPMNAMMEGPVLHTNPPYARIPGISVYGMLCVQGGSRKSRISEIEYPPMPWQKVMELYNMTMNTKPIKRRNFRGTAVLQ